MPILGVCSRSCRLFWVAWKFHLKGLTLSNFLLVSVTSADLRDDRLHVRGGRPDRLLLYVALGAGLMGMWSSTLFGSGGAIQWQRWRGTLRDRGRRSAAVLAGSPAADAGDGLDRPPRSRDAVLGVVLFDVPLTSRIRSSSASFPATTVALRLLGLVMASTFVLCRHASAFSNLLEYPVWLVSGLLVPVSLLPFWVEPLSWVLAPTGVESVRASAIGDPLPAIAMCVLLSAAYLAIGWFSMANFERLARKRSPSRSHDGRACVSSSAGCSRTARCSTGSRRFCT